MLRNREDKLPTIEEIDAAFENIEQEYYIEKRYNFKRNMLYFFLSFLFYIPIIFIIYLMYVYYDTFTKKYIELILVLFMFAAFIPMAIEIIVNKAKEKLIPKYLQFKLKKDLINSYINYISTNIYDWTKERNNIDINKNFILLLHIKNKIYNNKLFFGQGKKILKSSYDDLDVTNTDVLQIYRVGILKDEIYECIYEILEEKTILTEKVIESILAKFKTFEIEFNKIEKLPKYETRTYKLKSFLIAFKHFNFSEIDSYRKLKQIVNNETRGVLYDIERRRLEHTTIAAIKRNLESFKIAKSFFNFIEPKRMQFELNPFKSYFDDLQSFVNKFEKYLNSYNLKSDAPKYVPQIITNKKSYIPIEPKEKIISKVNNEKNKTIIEDIRQNIKSTSTNTDNNLKDSSTEQNAKIGLLGEFFVLNYEKIKLKKFPLYVNAIEHTSQVKGDSIGYDIKSFSEDGESIFIEVKTTVGNLYSNFFITKNEMELLKSNKNYCLYRVFEFDEKTEEGKLKIYKSLAQVNDDFEIFPVSYSVKPNT